MSVDVLAIGAHPDDVEMICGGTLAKLIDRGKSVAIVDMTRGEMGTRGTPQQRAIESANAAAVLGVSERVNLDLGDGILENTAGNRARVIEEIRRLRPTLVLSHYWEDLHPDHIATAEIIKSIMYSVGFEKYPATGDPYRPNEFLFFMAHLPFEPSFIVDVTGYHEKKLESVRCYKSQLHNPDAEERITGISQPDFLLRLESRARFYGSQIGVTFGEPFLTRRPVPMTDPVDHYKEFPKV